MAEQTIVFDFGGVLIDWNPRYLYRSVFEKEAEMEWFLEHICTSEWNLKIDAGKPFADSVRELSGIFPEWAHEIEAFHSGWEKMLGGEIMESVRILKEIQSRQYKVYGLTNWSAETFPVALNQFDFLQSLDGIVVSGAEKLVKPDPAIFHLLLGRYKLKAKDCVFIDDNINNVNVASSLGFDAIHFIGASQLRKALADRGII